MRVGLPAIGLALCLCNAAYASTTITQSTTGTLTIKIAPVFGPMSFSPPSPISNFPCAAAPGTVVAQASVSGGDGTAISWTASGDTADFTISPTSGAAINVIVGPNGIASGNCGATQSISLQATQN